MESTLNQMSNPFEDELPPGFRFHPTDEELVTYYLTNKLLDSTFSSCAVAEADLNKCEPWDLPAKAKIGEKEWYFFSLRDRKYPRGVRTNRATEAGFWKTTGKDREVFSSRSSAPVGMKRNLVFYKGRAPKAQKTKWVMHEYRVQGKLSCHSLPINCKTEWVVCRIYKKRALVKRSSIGTMTSHAYIDLPGSPSFPSLLESPRNTAAGNDQKTRSSERQAGTSTNVHDESCFSIPMEPKAHYLHQIQSGSNANYLYPSDQVSELYRIKEDSSYMHNLMVNDRRINMNKIPRNAHFSVSNIRGGQISAKLEQQPKIQQLPGLQPSIACDPHMPLTSNYSNLGISTDAYSSALHSSNVVPKVLLGQSAGIPVEPFSSSNLHHRTLSYNSSVGANNCVNSLQWPNHGLSQGILSQLIQKADGATCLTSIVCNPLDRSLDQLDSSAASPVDLRSLWYIREH